MKPRKIVLLAACAVLLVIAIIQGVSSARDTVKILSVKDEIDEVRIESAVENFTAKIQNEAWVVGDKKLYPATNYSCEALVERLSEIKLLDKVAHGSSEELLDKYGLSSAKAIKVQGFSKGSEKRAITVGKTSSTGTQCYIMVGDSKDIYLANGNLANDFGKTIADIRSKTVLELTRDDITSISVEDDTNGSAWALSRGGEGNIWTLTGSEAAEKVTIDAEKASGWFQSCCSISAVNWLQEGESPVGEHILKVVYKVGTKEIDLNIYQSQDEDGDNVYQAMISTLPYGFRLAQYAVQKYQKNPEDFGD